MFYNKEMGWCSSVGIAIRYWMDGSGIECVWGQGFPHPSKSTLWPLQNGYHVFLSGVKRPGRGVDLRSQSSAEIKEKLELHSYSRSGISWFFLGRHFYKKKFWNC
jgi:hypothetical protein